jgi:hypothetical protein
VRRIDVRFWHKADMAIAVSNVRFGVVGCCLWMRRRNQRLEPGFASQKIALGSTWEAAQTGYSVSTSREDPAKERF